MAVFPQEIINLIVRQCDDYGTLWNLLTVSRACQEPVEQRLWPDHVRIVDDDGVKVLRRYTGRRFRFLRRVTLEQDFPMLKDEDLSCRETADEVRENDELLTRRIAAVFTAIKALEKGLNDESAAQTMNVALTITTPRQWLPYFHSLESIDIQDSLPFPFDSGPVLDHYARPFEGPRRDSRHGFARAVEERGSSSSSLSSGIQLYPSLKTLPYLIGYCARASLSYVESDGHRATLLFYTMKEFCDDFWYPSNERPGTRSKPKMIDGNDLENVLRAALEQGDYNFFNDACMMHGDVLPPTFFTWAKNWLKDPNTDSDFDDFLKEGCVLNQRVYTWKKETS
ncbi:hypothetical protein B0T09DRAFT_402984 [Sordaria sp. MPI-SDFR-AT-0083]|nr:hypothetical protein B0T09DRAFT_402984 [Sordaria sp. MPI-SDFR-AT-0083]